MPDAADGRETGTTMTAIGLPGLTSDGLGKPMRPVAKCWFAPTSSGPPPRAAADAPTGGKAAAAIHGMNGPPAVPRHSYCVRVDVERSDHRPAEVAAQPVARYEIPSHLAPAEFAAALGAMLDRLRDEPGAAPDEATAGSVSNEPGGSRCGLW